MVSRLRQMVVTDSSENRINWATKVEDSSKRQRMIKSVANMLFVRGEVTQEVPEISNQLFNDPRVYGS